MRAAGGLDVRVGDGKLAIVREGRESKFRRRVDAVITCDGFQIAPGLEDECGAMAREMQQRFYGNVTRYASGALRRMKVVRSLEV